MSYLISGAHSAIDSSFAGRYLTLFDERVMQVAWLFLIYIQIIVKVFATNSTCLPGKEFDCGNGTMKCIPSKWKCDNVPDCENGADERNCTYSHNCPTGFMMCGNGVCVSKMLKCDGENDCADGSDELSCEYDPVMSNKTDISEKQKNCRDGFSLCHSGSSCIKNEYFCDETADCDDASDELNCKEITTDREMLAKHGHLRTCAEAGMFVCKPKNGKRGMCLPMKSTCNGVKECPLGDDEPEKCTECSRLQCEHSCTNSIHGSSCFCLEGFMLEEDGRTCKEMDQCSIHGHKCQQLCENRMGSFVCKCAPGYHLKEDGRQCTFDKNISQGYLFYGLQKEVRQVAFSDHYNGTNYTLVQKYRGPGEITSIDFMHRTNQLFMAISHSEDDSDASTGQLAVSEGGKMRTLCENLPGIGNIAVDWVGGNVFFTQNYPSKVIGISVCSMNGQFCRLIETGHEQSYKTLAVHPIRGLIFWMYRTYTKIGIKMANMDGSNVQTLMKDTEGRLMAFDRIRDDVYILRHGKLERINIDTRKRTVITNVKSAIPEDMVYFNGMVYLADRYMENIALIDTAINVTNDEQNPFFHIDKAPYHLAINHSLYQVEPEFNPCTDLDCPWICVVVPGEGRKLNGKCLCPDGYRGPDLGVKCFSPSSDRKIQEQIKVTKNGTAGLVALIIIVLLITALILGTLTYFCVVKKKSIADVFSTVCATLTNLFSCTKNQEQQSPEAYVTFGQSSQVPRKTSYENRECSITDEHDASPAPAAIALQKL